VTILLVLVVCMIVPSFWARTHCHEFCASPRACGSEFGWSLANAVSHSSLQPAILSDHTIGTGLHDSILQAERQYSVYMECYKSVLVDDRTFDSPKPVNDPGRDVVPI
jgi:hypothetical protein